MTGFEDIVHVQTADRASDLREVSQMEEPPKPVFLEDMSVLGDGDNHPSEPPSPSLEHINAVGYVGGVEKVSFPLAPTSPPETQKKAERAPRQTLKTCRICSGGPDEGADPSDRLISPCKCSGSMKYVHLSCLNAWREIGSAQNRKHFFECSTCHYRYQFSRTAWADTLTNRWFIRLLTVLALCGSVLIGGYVGKAVGLALDWVDDGQAYAEEVDGRGWFPVEVHPFYSLEEGYDQVLLDMQVQDGEEGEIQTTRSVAVVPLDSSGVEAFYERLQSEDLLTLPMDPPGTNSTCGLTNPASPRSSVSSPPQECLSWLKGRCIYYDEFDQCVVRTYVKPEQKDFSRDTLWWFSSPFQLGHLLSGLTLVSFASFLGLGLHIGLDLGIWARRAGGPGPGAVGGLQGGRVEWLILSIFLLVGTFKALRVLSEWVEQKVEEGLTSMERRIVEVEGEEEEEEEGRDEVEEGVRTKENEKEEVEKVEDVEEGEEEEGSESPSALSPSCGLLRRKNKSENVENEDKSESTQVREGKNFNFLNILQER